MTMVHGHTHAGNIKRRAWIIRDSLSNNDWDTVADELDDMIDDLPFVIEDSRGVFLSQEVHGEELVRYLEEECGENPRWFKERLDHVDNAVWYRRDLSPPRT